MKPYYETELGKLYHGDCLEIMPGLELDSIHLMIADPPYGTDFDFFNRPKKQALGKWAPNKNYEEIPYSWNKKKINPRFFELRKIMGENQIIFGGQYYTDLLPPTNCWIIWDKNNTGNFGDFEMAWTSFKGANRIIKWTWNGAIKQVPEKRVHPNQKPEGLILELINKYSIPFECVIDPTLGSGTTAVACERLERKWIGIEIEEKYCEIAAKRIEAERKQLKLF